MRERERKRAQRERERERAVRERQKASERGEKVFFLQTTLITSYIYTRKARVQRLTGLGKISSTKEYYRTTD